MPIFLGNNKAYRRKTAMIEEQFTVEEIYPKIFVYKNIFKDINKTYQVLKDSEGTEDEFFGPWSQWSSFGEYIYRTVKEYDYVLDLEDIKKLETKTQKAKDQKDTLIEILENFYLSTNHYIESNQVDFNIDDVIAGVTDQNGNEIKKWRMTGPSIARYRTDITDPLAMTYHSDYIREPIVSPGYKFAVTALVYFNDTYEGGEIDFYVDGKAYMYKPEAGDFLVFPSGHPDILTHNESVYIHGVMPASGDSKYLARMYWQKYSIGDDEWFEKEKKFGKDVWKSMQDEIMKDFREKNPNRQDVPEGARIK